MTKKSTKKAAAKRHFRTNAKGLIQLAFTTAPKTFGNYGEKSGSAKFFAMLADRKKHDLAEAKAKFGDNAVNRVVQHCRAKKVKVYEVGGMIWAEGNLKQLAKVAAKKAA